MSQSWRGGGWKRGGSRGGGSSAGNSNTSRPRKPCANPVFASWLEEWKDEADAKGSKMKFVYAKALESLKKYPLPLTSGKDCGILQNFGAHVCKMIENRMVKENMFPIVSTPDVNLNDTPPEPSQSSTSGEKTKKSKKVSKNHPAAVPDEDDMDEAPVSPKPKKKTKQYLPPYRSGAYALLVALITKENEPDYRGYVTKSELQHDAQQHCDASMTKPDKGSHYTAWNSMKVLTNKELVMRRGNPSQYFLTPEGRTLAVKLANAKNSEPPPPPQTVDVDNIPIDTEASSQDEDNDAFVAPGVRLEAGNFEIVLYVDTCETNGRSKPQDVINELQRHGVTVYVNRLSVGDFVWVCRGLVNVANNRNRLTLSSTNELILPYVVERKRSDDLASSIKDGRFHEQKFRLMQTKLQPIYLIESYGKGDWGLAEGALGQAITNTQVVNRFLIQETTSIKDSCAYLTFMTRHLKKLYENKTIFGCSKKDWPKLKDSRETYLMHFSEFNDFSVKKVDWNVKEMFARHLLRMKGLSVDKAYAIVQKYPTLDHLFKAYKDCETDKEKDLLLSTIHFGTAGRKIGPSVSRKISRFYNTTDLS